MCNRILFVLLFGINACGNPEQKITENSTAIASSATAENSNSSSQDQPNENCSFLFPAGLQKDLAAKNLEVAFAVQTDKVCDQRYENEKTKAVLWINLEKFDDTAQLKRIMMSLAQMPGYLGLIDAGDGGTMFHETTNKSEIIRAAFRAGSYKCIIQSSIPENGKPADGILFTEDEIRQLAMDWGTQLKQL
ncbi:MAG: hypothetical protein MUE38_09045 [Flavihumibacter sp.]|jgi:hypothetical protein|nr:hypothetical protein [Flavihumibacter sp.]